MVESGRSTFPTSTAESDVLTLEYWSIHLQIKCFPGLSEILTYSMSSGYFGLSICKYPY